MLNAIKLALKNCLVGLHKDKIGYVFAALFVFLFGYILYNNWVYMLQYATSDFGGEYLYFKKVLETGNPFTVQYANSDESFVVRSWFIMAPFYFLTKNLILSANLTLLTTTILLALSIYYFFRKLDLSFSEIFLGLLMIFGFFAGKGAIDTMNYLPETVMFRHYNGYVTLVIGLLITLAFFAEIYEKNKLGLLKTLVGVIIAFFLGLSGIKMFCILYAPILLVELIGLINAKLQKIKFNKLSLIYACELLASNLIAFLFYAVIIAPYRHASSFVSKLGIIQQEKFFDNLLTDFFLFLRAIGISFNGMSLLSLSACLTICAIALYCVLIFSMPYIKQFNIITKSQNKVLSYLLASVVLLGVYFILTGYAGWYHYWFAALFGIVLLTIFSYRLAVIKQVNILKYVIIMLVLSGITINGFYVYGNKVEEKTPIMSVTEYLMESNCERVIGTFWNTHIISFLSNANINSLCIQNNDNLSKYDWITDRTFYTNDDEPITLILTGRENKNWQESPSKSFLLSLAESSEEKFGYWLYVFDKNPFAFNMLEFGLNAKFNFMNLFYTDNAILANGGITLVNGSAQYGPYCTADAGSYEIIIRGINLDKADFDVISCGGKIKYKPFNVIISSKEIRCSFNLSENVSDLEIRTFNNQEEHVVIYDIILVKQNVEQCW